MACALEGIRIIEEELKGVSIIAHPERVRGVDEMIGPLVEMGVSGIEVRSPKFRKVAKHYNLIVSIGNDSHGLFDDEKTKQSTYWMELEEEHIAKLYAAISERKK